MFEKHGPFPPQQQSLNMAKILLVPNFYPAPPQGHEMWMCEQSIDELRGRPFDSQGGGGGLALLVGTDYLFSSRARPENLFPGKSRTEYLFSTATNFLKSQKKGGKGGGGVVRWLSSGGRTWLSMFCVTFCRLLACNIVY